MALSFKRSEKLNTFLHQPTPSIRSFVCRQGRFTKAQQAAVKNYWPIYGIDVTDQPLDLHGIFGNSHAMVLDIGFGNGDALTQLAQQYPQINFLGVEVYRSGIGSLLSKIAALKLNNIRVINMDVAELLPAHVSEKSLASVLVWFPDPWPKPRHHKRRLIQMEFVQLVASKLVCGGEFNIATDWQPYASHIQATVQQSGLFEQVHAADIIKHRPLTKFEGRGEKLGHKIFARVYRKIPRPL